MRILFVDDEPNILEQAEIFLEKEVDKLDIDTITSAGEGLELLEKNDYDCVVSDFQMPGMDGLDFLKAIREGDDDIPFIVFTGKGRGEVAIEALNLGANRYLQKGGSPKSQYGLLAQAIVQEVDHYLIERERDLARREWRKTFDALPDIACLISPDHEFIRVNKRGAEALGMDQEDIIGEKCYEVVHDQDEPIEECPCTRVLGTGEPDFGEEFEENGSHYIAAASPIRDENGEIEAFAHTVKDITERKKVEEKFRENSERLKTIFETADDAIVMTDLEGNILEANQAAARMTGFDDKEEYMKHNAFEFVHPEDREIAMEATKKTFKEGAAQDRGEYRIVPKDGEVIHTSTRAGLLRDENGKPVATVNIVRDITDRKRGREKLRRSREKYKSLTENTSDIILRIDLEGSFTYLSRNVEDEIGYSSEELLGENISEILAPESYEKAVGRIKKWKEGAESLPPYEVEVKTKDDGTAIFELTTSPIFEDGGLEEIQVTARNITDRKKIEERYVSKSNLLNSLLDNANDLVYFKDKEERYIRAGKAYADALGLDKPDMEGKTAFDFFPNDQAKRIHRDDLRVMEKGEKLVDEEREVTLPDGENRWFSTTKVPRYDDEGNIIGIVGVSRDITERKKSEEELRKVREQFRKIFETSPDLMALVDENGRFLSVNPAMADSLEYSVEELEGRTFHEVMPADTADERLEYARRAVEEKEIQLVETKREGRHFQDYYVRFPSSGGKKTFLVVSREITERKRLEEELRQYQTAVESSRDSIYMVDEDLRYVFVNREHLSRMLDAGYISKMDDGELVGKNFRDCHPVEEVERFSQKVKEVFETGESQREIFKALYTDRWSDRTYSPIKDPESREVKAVVVVSKNITEKMKTEEKLKLFKWILESSDDSIFIVDEDCRFELANTAELESHNISLKEFIGLKFRDLHPEEDFQEFEKKVRKALETGESQRQEVRHHAVHKGFFIRTLSPIENPETGRMDKVVVISKDITERKKMEEREDFLHSLLRHDVRNKAQIVEGYLELLKDTELSEEQEELVDKAMKGSEDGIDIIEKVRTLRKIGMEEEIEEIGIRGVIKNVISEREAQASEKNIKIEVEVESCRVHGGPLLKELFSNLVENSIKHASCGEIRISSRETDSKCIVMVEDDGKGVPEDIREKVFEKGFKSSETGGSGLGLFLVKEITESYNSSIEVKDSELGGARFVVHLKKLPGEELG